MKKLFWLLVVLLIAIGFFGGWLVSNSQTPADTANRTAAVSPGNSARIAPKAKQESYYWHDSNLKRHYGLHKSEFPELNTMREYGDCALEFFRNPPEGTLFKRRPSGDRLFYYEKDNYFGVTAKDGAVKTFFRPDRGIRYWHRQ